MVIGRNKKRKGSYSVHNITFFDGEKSVQIDHVLVNRSGIHVIETKNYAGRIYGNDKDRYWTQVLAYGKVKNKLYNPLHQNYGHIMGLKAVLDYELDVYHGYVVFTGRADIMTEFQGEVLYPNKLKKSIRRKEKVLSPLEAKEIYLQLVKLKKENTITNKQHVESINERLDKRGE